MGEIMETLVNNLFIAAIMIFAVLFTYLGLHMAKEKDQKKRLPLLWEKGGLFNRTYHKVFDKSKVKYFDGDNT